MSTKARVPDIERTATMLDLLHRQHEGESNGGAPSWVVVEEVAPGTGWAGANRWADVLALSMWPSRGLALNGYEIKASKADLKRELSDLSKHQAVARYCDSWTLVAWDEHMLIEGIPESWGVSLVVNHGDDDKRLREHRKATKLTPDPWPRAFTCSLVRNAHQQSPRAAFLARMIAEMDTNSLKRYRRDMAAQQSSVVRPLAEALFGRESYKWPTDAKDPARVVQIAVERLTQLPL